MDNFKSHAFRGYIKYVHHHETESYQYNEGQYIKGQAHRSRLFEHSYLLHAWMDFDVT
jgi:hypothetical protein